MPNSLNSADDEIDLRELIAALWAYKIFIILITGFSIFISGYYALTAEKEFTASAVFKIDAENRSGFNIPGELGALASLAGLSAGSVSSGADALLERISAREFILSVSEKYSLSNDPLFNTYNPSYTDPLWKAYIKRLIGWQKTKAEQDAIINYNIIKNYQSLVEVKESDGGALIMSVTHTDPKQAADYANGFMHEISTLVKNESDAAQNLKLTYLSKTLADALQDVDQTQQNLKDYALKNSALAQENFISGSLKLDETRMERRKVTEIASVLSVLDNLVKNGKSNDSSYKALRLDHPLVDDVNFRRILGMSETISAWTWPTGETIEAISTTLKDRINRLDVDIQNIENNAKIYATSAEDLAKYTREAKIAEATYIVLIEQVKSQTLAAGFQTETFKVYEYAAPPMSASFPNRKLLLAIGAVLGLITSCAMAVMSSTLRGVYYSKAALETDTKPDFMFKAKPLRKLSRSSIEKISLFISKRRIVEAECAEINLANKKLIYVVNNGGRTSASGTARLLATQSSRSGRKVVLFDKTGQTQSEFFAENTQEIAGLPISKFDEKMDVIGAEGGKLSFTSSRFSPIIENLLSKYDQVFVCANSDQAFLGLMALKDFAPSIVLMAGLRKTRKIDIKRMRNKHTIDILFYD